MTATLPNGVVIAGTPQEMQALLGLLPAAARAAPPPYPPDNMCADPKACPAFCAGGRAKHDPGCIYDPATYAVAATPGVSLAP